MKRKTTWIVIIGIIVLVTGIFTVFTVSKRPLSEEKQQQLTSDLSRPFQAVANIKLDGLNVVADINKTASNQLTMQVTEPQTLKGLTISYNGSDITVAYLGMQAVIDDDSLLAKTMAGIIMHSIQSATEDTGVQISEQDGILTISGESDEGAFVLKLDKQSGAILSLRVPQMDLECEFSQFLFTEDSSEQQTENINTESKNAE